MSDKFGPKFIGILMVIILVAIAVTSVLLVAFAMYKLEIADRAESLEGDIQEPQGPLIMEKEFKYITAEIIFMIFIIFVLGGLTIWLIVQI